VFIRSLIAFISLGIRDINCEKSHSMYRLLTYFCNLLVDLFQIVKLFLSNFVILYCIVVGDLELLLINYITVLVRSSEH
jgi:hypothetical protein